MLSDRVLDAATRMIVDEFSPIEQETNISNQFKKDPIAIPEMNGFSTNLIYSDETEDPIAVTLCYQKEFTLGFFWIGWEEQQMGE